MKKIRLLTPGPTAIPESVLSKFSEPVVHHRTSLFEAEFKILQEHLGWLFQTKNEVLTLTCTGTGAMEASVAGVFSPGDEVIVVNAGKFGERFSKIARVYGLGVREIVVERGRAIDPVLLERCLQEFEGIKAVLFQASETSTGALMPVREIAALCKKYGVLSVCDGITAVGIFDLPMDSWGLDVLITGSQKALMLPPGLAFIALSDAAWVEASSSRSPKFYFDLVRERKMQQKQQTAWTPGISLIQGGVKALGMLREEGLPAIFERHERLARATRSAVKALGLELFSSAPSPVLTTVKVPERFSVEEGKRIQKIMQEEYGVIITGGQDELQGRILRLSHFGYCDLFDVMTGIGALEMALADLGHPVAFGSGTGAVLTSYRLNDRANP
ncbi:alanine--glyoxylate aminotransferase family protein [bacterium]|jgi:aspartate aminotransferase-like enzyme|nr:alanine--glyoxylate aminotransferase family protein [bacterium]